MARNAAEILVETMIAAGIDTVFGLAGDGINGIIEALRTRTDRIRFVAVRHEENAAFMACAWGKLTGQLAACLATSGPGGIHLLNGLYDAKLDRVPVLAITGLQFHDLLDTFTQQDVDLDRLFADVSEFSARVMGPAHVENLTLLACRTALARCGVAHLSIPIDVQIEPLSEHERSRRNVPHHASRALPENAQLPSEFALDRAAALLNQSQRVAILAGRGARDAREQLLAVADTLGAPIVKALLGKAVVPDNHPLTTGGIGLLGTRPSQEAFERCDALLIVGSTFPYIEFYPRPGQARGAQIDLDAQRIGLRFPVEVGLVGDAAATLERLLPRLERKQDRAFLTDMQQRMQHWREQMDEWASRGETPMQGAVVARALSDRLRDDAIVVTDSGQNTEICARHVAMRGDMDFAVSGLLASMGCGLPYAIAAQIAWPDRQVVAIVGDGGLAMVLGEFATAVKYRLPIKIVVLANQVLGQIKWEQMMFLGNPEWACDLQPIDFAKAAEAMGGAGYRIETPDQAGDVLDRALAEAGPVIIHAVTDPNEPMLPPKISDEFRQALQKALRAGTPGAAEIEHNLAQPPLLELMER
ncbi:MAG: pyruvate oxidase [Gemmatimonadales bacterium]|nr:pyruvate oxidase [Gemmatimonadales bacterium]MDB5367495.1 pyruvate oxidase [Rhodospirillales bacterium]